MLVCGGSKYDVITGIYLVVVKIIKLGHYEVS